MVNAKEIVKTCPQCKKKFEGRSNKTYCSAYCRFKKWAQNNPRVKKETILAILFLTLVLLPCTFASDYSSFTDEQIVAAIGKTENSVKFPYGIKSINTYSNKEYAYKICFNSVRNGRARWIKAGRPGDLVTFIGRRFSPPSVNPNWTRLVKYFLDNSKSNFTHIDVR